MKNEFIKINSFLEIILTRDSVSAGDDCNAPHKKRVNIDATDEPEIFIRNLIINYLPNVGGIGHTWDCILNGELIGIISVSEINSKVTKLIYLKENHIHFKYHSSIF